MLITVVQCPRTQCSIEMMNQTDIHRIIQTGSGRQQTRFTQQFFGMLESFTGTFFILLPGQPGNQCIDTFIDFGITLSHTGNNERRASFIDQNRIDLIHNCKIQHALYPFRAMSHHIVTQIIKAIFIVRAVGYICGISSLFFLMRHL